MKRVFFITVVALSLVACGGGTKPEKPQEKQLNISILLDLSDRISPSINPDAQKHDIENIKTITEFFKSNTERLGAYKAKGKIRIFLNPPPANADINSIVSKLIIDCSGGIEKKDYRKEVYKTISDLYTQNLEEVYQQTISTSAWKGSDIWGFFKNNVKDFCIDKDTNYRNILIIFTDGYLYDDKNNPIYDKNRFANIPPKKLANYRTNNWQTKIQQDDFGFKTEVSGLNNLEILVLGVKAENSAHIFDASILTFLLENWFNEMNVSNYKICPFDLPANTKTRIENFLNQK